VNPLRTPRLARRRPQRGQSFIEYGIAIAVIALLVLALLSVLGNKIFGAVCQASTGLGGGARGCQLYAWGYNVEGQLGVGNITDPQPSPSAISNMTAINSVGAGLLHTLVIKAGGDVWSVGMNLYGELGRYGGNDLITPGQISGLSNIKAVAAGENFSVVLKSDGSVWTFGENTYGELGIGTATGGSNTDPVQVCAPTGCGTKLSGITAIATGEYHTLALKSDGTVYAWGSNGAGQLGTGNPVCAAYFNTGNPCVNATDELPVVVSGLSGVTAISSRFYTSMALKSDGTVYDWGDNTYGQLGFAACGLPAYCSGSIVPV
jgi:alpha-tubulin suppressor-like RCC1 family protein/Flp pilus assembly pilin Flp